MRVLVFLAFALFSAKSAAAGQHYPLSELTDSALVQLLDDIVDELDLNNHDQDLLNMAYNRGRVVRKAANKYLEKLNGLENATDDDIKAVIKDIEDQIEALAHTLSTMAFMKNHLDTVLLKLEENRTSPKLAVLTFNDANTLDAGAILPGDTHVFTLAILNLGDASATFIGTQPSDFELEAPFSFDGGVFPGSAGTCQEVLPPESSCAISVVFKTINYGSYEDVLAVRYNDGASVQTVSKKLMATAD